MTIEWKKHLPLNIAYQTYGNQLSVGKNQISIYNKNVDVKSFSITNLIVCSSYVRRTKTTVNSVTKTFFDMCFTNWPGAGDHTAHLLYMLKYLSVSFAISFPSLSSPIACIQYTFKRIFCPIKRGSPIEFILLRSYRPRVRGVVYRGTPVILSG